MPVSNTYVKLTPVDASPEIELLGADEITRDAIGNVTLTWSDPLESWTTPERITAADLNGYLSTGVQQIRNRANAYLCITDPDGVLCDVEWTEWDSWTGPAIGPYIVRGVVVLASARSARESDGLSLIVYRAQYRYERTSGIVES